jgi:hypothetical protein
LHQDVFAYAFHMTVIEIALLLEDQAFYVMEKKVV